MAEKVEVEVVAKTDKAVEALSNLESKLGDVSSAGQENKEGFDILDQATGGYAGKLKELSGKVKAVIASAKGFIKTLKGVKGALLATGIGAVVVGLSAIVFYWKEISEFFEGAEESLQDQADSLRESLGLLDNQITLLNLQIKLLDEQGLSSKELVKEKRKLILLQQEENTLLLEKLKQQLEIENAQVREVTFLEKLKIKAAESFGIYSLAAKEQSKAMAGTEEERANLLDLENKIQKAKERGLKLELDLINLDKEKTTEKKKVKDAEIQAEKDKQAALERIRKGLIDTEAEERAEKLRLIQADYDEQIKLAEKYYGKETEKVKELREAQRLALEAQQLTFDEQDKAKILEKQEKAAEQYELDKEFDLMSFEEQRSLIAEREALMLEDTALTDQQKIDLKQQFADKEIEIDLASKEAKAAVQNATLDVAQKGISVLKDIAGENVAVQKALLIAEGAAGIAKILVNTGVANAKAVSASPITGGMPWVAINSVSAGLGIAGNIAATAKGLSALGGGSPKGGGGVPRSGGAPAQTQAPSFNVVGATETSVLADTVAEQTQEPVQAYVVSNDVTTAQSLENNIVEGATL